MDPGSGPGRLMPLHSLTGLPGGNSKRVPPDPISNSEVKLLSADGSVGPPHVRVGHRQALEKTIPGQKWPGIFLSQICVMSYSNVVTDLPGANLHDPVTNE